MHLYYDHTLYGHKNIHRENYAEYDHSIGAYSKLSTRIYTYTMIILCIVFLHKFLSPKDGPQWPEHVVSIINRIQDNCVLTYPTLYLIAYNTTGMMHLKTHSHVFNVIFFQHCSVLTVSRFR